MYAVITRKAQLRGHPDSLYFEYNVWDSWEAMDADVQPDKESHVIQRNWLGKRIVRNADGWMRTTGGLWIDPARLLLGVPESKWEYEASSINVVQECRLLIERNLLSIATRNVVPRLARNIQYEDTPLGRLVDLEVIAIGEQRPQKPRGAASAVLDLQVGESSDDCARRITSSTFSLTADSHIGDFSDGNHDYRVGIRFQNVTVGQAATIDTAHLSLFGAGLDGTIPEVLMFGEDADDAITFVNLADYDGRARTSASVAWTPSSWSQFGDSNEIKALPQEIVNRGSWSSGNAQVYFLKDADGWGGTQGRLRVHNYDNDTSHAAKLHLEYTPAAVTRRIFITG